MTTTQTERPDAEVRLRELRAAIAALWPDRDDAGVISELTVLVAELRRAEQGVTRGHVA